MNANYAVNPYPNPAGGPGSANGHALSEFNAPASTVMLFEVANSTGYDISNNTGAYANGYNADNSFGGASPSGLGEGGDYDPNGFNGEAAAGATASDKHMKFATGYMRYSAPNGQFLAPTGRHTDGSNFLMSDTHAKFLRPMSVSAGANNPPNIPGYLCGGWYGAANTPGANAATVECGDLTIAATFNIQ